MYDRAWMQVAYRLWKEFFTKLRSSIQLRYASLFLSAFHLQNTYFQLIKVLIPTVRQVMDFVTKY